VQKNVLLPVLVAKNQSLAASFNSPATVIKYTDNIAYQINVNTTDSAGAFAVQVSLDYVPTNDPGGPANAGTWSTLPLSGTPVVAAANDTISIELNQVAATAIRLAYTSGTAGTGTCNITVAGKSLS
jgi:hypothetical protein